MHNRPLFLGMRSEFHASLFPLHHRLWIPRPEHAFLFRCAEQFGIQIRSTFLRRFLLLDRNAVSVGPRVLPDAGDLPRDLHVRFVTLDGEPVIGHLAGHDGLRELSHNCELIPEIAVEGFEPLGQGNDGFAGSVGGHVAVVDVHHVGRLHESVIEVPVGGIERMVDLERATFLMEIAVDFHFSVEPRGKARGAACQNSSAAADVIGVAPPAEVVGHGIEPAGAHPALCINASA
jgi:hypothetical protein